MGRPSPAALAAANRCPARDLIWEAFRKQKVMTATLAAAAGECEPASARTFLKSLSAAGIAEQQSGIVPATWVLLHDPGPKTPRYRADGTRVEQGDMRRRAWQAMKINKVFTAATLHISTGMHLENAKSYCKTLAKAGYLTVLSAGHGRGLKGRGTLTSYALRPSRYTGPLPPQVTKMTSVWDPNLAKFVWPVDETEGDAP